MPDLSAARSAAVDAAQQRSRNTPQYKVLCFMRGGFRSIRALRSAFPAGRSRMPFCPDRCSGASSLFSNKRRSRVRVSSSSMEGRRRDFGVDGVRIEISGQRRLQLHRARSAGKIFLRRNILASQASLQLQPLRAARPRGAALRGYPDAPAAFSSRQSRAEPSSGIKLGQPERRRAKSGVNDCGAAGKSVS